MAIIINLEQALNRRNMTMDELYLQIDIPAERLTIFRNGQSKGIRFETLDKLCEVLDCTPGDILKYVKK